ncbi:3-dehydroquinate synthase [Candidatus Shikimatogenerans silvanidophilus]|uniref:3-dehydroquinate synthase n=1 Tax=Candidatus Shikimatogenerans silvanidophilus TaxID=2782547 RepID=UPI001BAB4DD2|nr:3-dehydroquinate synthase [Candidatus Shikimatogenerans silvanidophilus]
MIFFNKKSYNKLNSILFKYSKIFILTDKNVKKHCLLKLFNNAPLLKNSNLIVIKPGEIEKNIYTCIYIWKKIIENKGDRNSLIINFGGGVITDIGGFIASLFKRGIDFINIPTTLLSMCDASIGGKNGIDFYNIKNEIGIFNNPKFILIDISYLETIPKKEFYSGISEIYKHGLIFDYNFWCYLKLNLNKKKEELINEELINIIKKSIYIKKKIFEKDPLEKNLRKILNFGHTIGHSIETCFIKENNPLTHGESIFIGMMCESWISYKMLDLSKKEYNDICNTFLKVPEINIKKNIYKKKNEILSMLIYDKKNKNGKIYFSLLNKIGKCIYNKEIKNNIIEESLKKINKKLIKN